MKLVDIGKIPLSDEMIKIVEEHKNFLLESHKDDSVFYNSLLNSPFRIAFIDLLFNRGYRLSSDFDPNYFDFLEDEYEV